MPSQFSMRIFQFYVCLFSDLKSSERQNHNCFPLREMNDDHASFSRHTRRRQRFLSFQKMGIKRLCRFIYGLIGYINAIEQKDVRTNPVGIILQLGMGFLVKLYSFLNNLVPLNPHSTQTNCKYDNQETIHFQTFEVGIRVQNFFLPQKSISLKVCKNYTVSTDALFAKNVCHDH